MADCIDVDPSAPTPVVPMPLDSPACSPFSPAADSPVPDYDSAPAPPSPAPQDTAPHSGVSDCDTNEIQSDDDRMIASFLHNHAADSAAGPAQCDKSFSQSSSEELLAAPFVAVEDSTLEAALSTALQTEDVTQNEQQPAAIESSVPSFARDFLSRAVSNYAAHHELDENGVTLRMLQEDAEGVQGWAYKGVDLAAGGTIGASCRKALQHPDNSEYAMWYKHMPLSCQKKFIMSFAETKNFEFVKESRSEAVFHEKQSGKSWTFWTVNRIMKELGDPTDPDTQRQAWNWANSCWTAGEEWWQWSSWLGTYLYAYEEQRGKDTHGERQESKSEGSTTTPSDSNHIPNEWERAALENRAKKNYADLRGVKGGVRNVSLEMIETDKLGLRGWAMIKDPATQGCGGGAKLGVKLLRRQKSDASSDRSATRHKPRSNKEPKHITGEDDAAQPRAATPKLPKGGGGVGGKPRRDNSKVTLGQTQAKLKKLADSIRQVQGVDATLQNFNELLVKDQSFAEWAVKPVSRLQCEILLDADRATIQDMTRAQRDANTMKAYCKNIFQEFGQNALSKLDELQTRIDEAVSTAAATAADITRKRSAPAAASTPSKRAKARSKPERIEG